jgi:hypothetical protein
MSAWAMLGLALVTPFGGKSTHLACTFAGADGPPAITIVVAPSYRAVALTIPSTGHVERRPAALSGASLIFDSPLQYGTVTYTISRADLTIVRTQAGPSVATTVAKGQCRLEATPALIF